MTNSQDNGILELKDFSLEGMMEFVEIDMRTRDKEWSMSHLQNHSYFEIYFLLEGSRRLFIDDRIFNVSAPAVCVIPPFCMHKTEGDAYRRININVSSDALCDSEAELLNRLSKKVAFQLSIADPDFFISFLEHAAALSHTHADQERLSISLVSVILAFLGDATLIPYTKEEAKDASKSDQAVMQAVTYIKNKFHEDFSLDELCNALFVSKNSLCSRFRSVMNCSVMEYRSFVRISKAKELLVSTKMGLGKIADECGYSSANYFSLIFKKEVGISPMNYRKAK